jgi:threonine/homoserine/homoserine lactone efflux protein
MSLLAFLVEATLISLSGVLAPGPITALVVGKGGQSPHAGALVAIGHGIVEVPLMVAVFYGVGRLMELSYVQAGIALLGGLSLLVMGVGMLRGIRQAEVGADQDTRSPIVAGILLSIGNPYFLVWWATVGAALIMRSFCFGVFGFVAFGALHWLCDLAWGYFLSALSFRGGAFFGRRFQQVVFAVCGMFLVFSSARLLVEAAKAVSG